MLKLVLKDLLIQKRTFGFSLLYTVFIIFVFNQPVIAHSVYILGSVAIAYMLVLTAIGYDEKNKSDILLLSLPVKRKDIVNAKYLSIFAFCITALAITGLIGASMKLAGLPLSIRFINGADVLAVFTSISILCALYYPFYFKFGSMYMRIINMLFFMAVFFLPNLLIKYFMNNFTQEEVINFIVNADQYITMTTTGGIMLLLCLMLFLSYLLSLKIYTKKEF